ncbi:MAG: hypothetical protein H8E87_02860 [FCB group bacterium]|nr:hypothetical protein [FCB group bacterium]
MLKKILLILALTTSVMAQAPDTLWTKTFGDAGNDVAYCGRQTADDGFIIVGSKNFNDWNTGDLYLIKTDFNGNLQWQKTYGSNDGSLGYCVEQTTDGGYIAVGATQHCAYIWLLKFDANGDTVWTKIYGGSGNSDCGYSVQQTEDEGYIIAGVYGYVGSSSANGEYYLIKTDNAGNLQWEKFYGGSAADVAYCAKQLDDGGYIVSGYTYSFGAGAEDVWLIRTDADGDSLWSQLYGDGGYQEGWWCLEKCVDGGFAVTGPWGGYYSEDFYLLKTDENGAEEWIKTYSSTNAVDYARCVQHTADMGYILAGESESGPYGDWSGWVVRTDWQGDSLWCKTVDGPGADRFHFVDKTSDGGYILTGFTSSWGAGGNDVWLVKLDEDPIDESITITVTIPNGGEEWIVGGTYQIEWNSLSPDTNVNIYLNSDYPTGDWETLFYGTVNDGSEAWFIDELYNSANCRIMVENSLNPANFDTSDNDFTITTPTITVTAPNGGDTLMTGGSTVITWEDYLLVGDVDIYLNYDYPAGSWEPLFNDIPNTGSQNWDIEGVGSERCRIKIASVNVPEIEDISDADFAIFPTIMVTAPNGGESLAVTGTHQITWDAPYMTGDVNIYLNSDYPAGDWDTLFSGTDNDGSEAWFIDELYNSANCRIKIESANSAWDNDISDDDFTIFIPTIAITAPNGGENIFVTDSVEITWEAPDLSGTVDIFLTRYYPYGPRELLFDNILNSGAQYWKIRPPGSDSCRIIIESTIFNSIKDKSDDNFTITVPVIEVTYPNGDEILAVGNNDTIRWEAPDLTGNVKITLYRDYPYQWETLAYNYPNSGYFPWNIRGVPSDSCRIRVSSMNAVGLYDDSNEDFSIVVPTITVLEPNGGETWVVGDSAVIEWDDDLLQSGVNIYLYRNWPNRPWETLFQDTTNEAHSVSWMVGGLGSDNCRIKIASTNATWNNDISDSNFSIVVPTITVLQPNGGETWVVGDSAVIEWDDSLLQSGVNISLTYHFPYGPWQTLFHDTTNEEHLVKWRVGGSGSDSCRIKIASTHATWNYDTSDVNFEIYLPTITVTYPNGGEIWNVGDSDTITWDNDPLYPYSGIIKIILTRHYPNGPWEQIALDSLNSGSWPWIVTGPESDSCRIKVASIIPLGINDFSDGNFSIVDTSIIILAGGENPDSPLENTDCIVTEFGLTCSPNPFNTQLQINYSIPEAKMINLRVFDILGREEADIAGGWGASRGH